MATDLSADVSAWFDGLMHDVRGLGSHVDVEAFCETPQMIPREYQDRFAREIRAAAQNAGVSAAFIEAYLDDSFRYRGVPHVNPLNTDGGHVPLDN